MSAGVAGAPGLRIPPRGTAQATAQATAQGTAQGRATPAMAAMPGGSEPRQPASFDRPYTPGALPSPARSRGAAPARGPEGGGDAEGTRRGPG